MDLDATLVRFELEYLEPNSISHDRRVIQAAYLRRVASTIDYPLVQIRPEDVRALIGGEIKSGMHPNTCRWHLGMLRSFFTWAAEAGVMDPTVALQLKSVSNPRGSSAQNRPRPYKTIEIARMRQEIAERYPHMPVRGEGSRMLRYLMLGHTGAMRRHLWKHAKRLQLDAQVALALELGLRRVEITRLTVDALHYDNDQVVVLTAKQGPGAQVSRVLPWTLHARETVREWLDFRALLGCGHSSPFLILTQQGDLARQTEPQPLSSLATTLARIGPGYSLHRLRHTAATEWLRSGVPLEKVSLFLGHSSLEQTLAYAQIVSADVEHSFGRAEEDFARRLGLAA